MGDRRRKDPLTSRMGRCGKAPGGPARPHGLLVLLLVLLSCDDALCRVAVRAEEAVVLQPQSFLQFTASDKTQQTLTCEITHVLMSVAVYANLVHWIEIIYSISNVLSQLKHSDRAKLVEDVENLRTHANMILVVLVLWLWISYVCFSTHSSSGCHLYRRPMVMWLIY